MALDYYYPNRIFHASRCLMRAKHSVSLGDLGLQIKLSTIEILTMMRLDAYHSPDQNLMMKSDSD